MEKKKILIAENQNLFKEGLKLLLAPFREYTIAGDADDGLSTIRALQDLQTDLLLMDLALPKMNGIDVIKEIRRQDKALKILVLTEYKDDEHIFSSFQAGADGYILKQDSQAELLIAIKSVFSGKRYLSPSISERVIQGFLVDKKRKKNGSIWENLTSREREILQLIAEGYKNKEIADLLYISVKTVGKHRSNLMKKLNLHNTASLTSYALNRGLIQ